MTRWLLGGLIILILSGSSPAEEPKKGPERVVFNTAAGDIVFALYPDVAPNHVRQFLKLVSEGVYDTTHFGRMEPGFVLQLFTAEDRRVPLSEEQRKLLLPLKAEFSKIPHRRGLLSMARLDNDQDSGCSSFSILLGPAPHLDGKYTIFGEVERGMDVVDELCKVPVDGNRPRVPLEVRKAIVVPTAKQLDEIKPVPAKAVDLPASVKSEPTGSVPTSIAGGLLLIVGVGAISFGLSGRLSNRVVLSLVLLQVLIGSFLLLIILAPMAPGHSVLGIGIFLGILGVLKLMSRFESQT